MSVDTQPAVNVHVSPLRRGDTPALTAVGR